MQSANDIHDLSIRIADAIARKLTAEWESGRINRSSNVLNLTGLIQGDHAARIDFGIFDIFCPLQDQSSVREDLPADAQPPPEVQGQEQIESLVDPSTLHEERRSRNRRRPSGTSDDSDSSEAVKRRKLTGGLRLAPTQQNSPRDPENPESTSGRQLQSTARHFPQRKPASRDEHALKPSTLNKLIVGVWEQIFSSIRFDMSAVVDEWHEAQNGQGLVTDADNSVEDLSLPRNQITRSPDRAFSRINVLCRKISQASRVSRALEVIVQARWVEHYDDRVRAIVEERGNISQTKAKTAALAEACRDFGWTEKELRNKMAIWRGYKEIKDAGGWVVLIFAGMGIYRFCKYRISFDQEAMQTLRRYKSRFEVAADTLHPHWREMLSIIDAASPRLYTGHPHDWVVSDYESPISLTQTYLEWDPHFAFTHLDTSIIDVNSWGASDPRLVMSESNLTTHICRACGEHQSDDLSESNCRCYPNLYGSSRIAPIPVQVFRTKNGKNNGLIACCPFDRGTAIGEFVGLITNGLDGVDTMQAAADQGGYQIWQGREGNHTRFVNHSCRPNSQFQRFVWIGVQRVVLVSRGIDAGQEITVDYSDSYWRNLEKICLCNEPCCRFKDRARIGDTS